MLSTRNVLGLFISAVLAITLVRGAQGLQGEVPTISHLVQPGDTWTALAIRYGIPRATLQSYNPHPNPARNPVLGDTITLPTDGQAQALGTLLNATSGGLLKLAVQYNVSPWQLAATNKMVHPFQPLHGQAILLPGSDAPPRQLPVGFHSLELSAIPAQPGWPLAFRARGSGITSASARVGTASFESFVRSGHIVAVGGTGAFFTPGAPELTIVTDETYLWTQPWRFVPGAWNLEQVTLSGEAAAIDQEAIAAEHERMLQIWTLTTAQPLWRSPFQVPIENYVAISSLYGARRSYNGGPYRSYHEGVDFSAYGGTPVYASGDGVVVLAEMLYVRGGAVVIDHGLGIYSGYYHMSAVHVQPGQVVTASELVGEVGSEGLSSGNHLHWDLLVGATWVDAATWHQQELGCWILEGWGTPCTSSQIGE